MNRLWVCLAAFGALVLLWPDRSLAEDDFTSVRMGGGDSKEGGSDGESFDEVVKDTREILGLFNLYHDAEKEQVWLEIRPEQLDHDFILSATQETGIGARGLLSGMPAGHDILRFRKVGNRIHAVKRNLMFRPAEGSQAGPMLERNYSDSPIASLEIQGEPHEDRKSWLVNAADLFLKDLTGVGPRVERVLDGNYQREDELCWLDRLQSFPSNTEIGASLAFSTDKPKQGWSTLEDPRFLEIRVRYSLSEVPASTYQPRLADARVGFFQTGWRQFGDDSPGDPMIRLANRWHLEKKDPAARVSEPVKPIVFWLENAIPEAYRDVIREGVLVWNEAFEEAGFRNAVVVNQMPDSADWDPADIRYNTLRWISSNEPSFGAMGPSQVNPYTGEILNADILIEADMVRRAGWAWRSGVNPRGDALPDPGADLFTEGDVYGGPSGTEQRLPGCLSHGGCRHGLLIAEASDLAGLSLLAQGMVQPGGELPWEYVRQYLFSLTAHEVGHTLGLRHNFRGSRLLPFESLHDTVASADGLVNSVMEYDPPNIALDAADQGDYFTRTLGPYDRWAIRWGYTPSGASTLKEDLAALENVAALSTKPELIYGTDEDAYDVYGWGSAVDPQCRIFDLSSDELAWTDHQLKLARKLMAADPARVLAPGDDYLVYRSAFSRAFGLYWSSTQALVRYAGALRTRREPAAAGLSPMTPYTGAEQRQALELLVNALTDPAPWQVPAATLDRLGQGYRWSFDGSTDVDRVDLPLHDLLARNREVVLMDLFAPKRLARVSELAARPGALAPLTLDEVFSLVSRPVWQAPAADLDQRALQNVHAEVLMLLLTNDKHNADRDTRLLARAELQGIRARVLQWQAQRAVGDRLGLAHLADLDARIDAALKLERDRL